VGLAATEKDDDAAEDVADELADDEAEPEPEDEDELLLLPHPTIAAMQITESGAANQLLHVRMYVPPCWRSPRSWRQDMQPNGLGPKPLTASKHLGWRGCWRGLEAA
jgi:hypothetical protein